MKKCSLCEANKELGFPPCLECINEVVEKKKYFRRNKSYLKRFMKFVWFYQPKAKKNWQNNCLKEWIKKGK